MTDGAPSGVCMSCGRSHAEVRNAGAASRSNTCAAFKTNSDSDLKRAAMTAAIEPMSGSSRESTDECRDLLDFLPWGCLVLDESFRILQLNAAAVRLLGRPREVLLGTSLTRYLRDSGLNRVFDGLRCGAGAAIRVEGSIRATAGDAPRVVELHAQACREGDATRFRIGMLDTTGMREADSALLYAARDMRDLYQNAPCGYHSLAPDATVVQINDTELRWLGYDRAEVLGKFKLTDLLEAGSRGEFESAFAWLKEHGEVRDLELDFRRKDSTVFPALLSATAVKGPAGEFLESRASVFDITQRRLAEREAEHYARRLKGMSRRAIEIQESERRALAQELHDRVGQNLTALNINLNILKGALASVGAAGFRARLDDSLQLVDRTVDAIRDVMTELRPAVLDDYGLAAVLRWYAEDFSRRTGIAVGLSSSDPVPRLPAAAEMALFRIVQEALTNVAKHAAASQVTLQLRTQHGDFELCIADDGRGFHPDAADSPGERGGWGLMIMRERADSVGATLRLDAAPGRGTRVVVNIESSPT